jgi:hypothetical protein
VTAPEGPYLYDEGPEESPFTGSPRRRGGTLVLILLATVVVAVGAVIALPLIKGTAAEQSTEAASVFVQALHQGDTETAYGLLCEAERARLQPGDVAAEYLRSGTPRVGEAEDAELDGSPAERVAVRWTDGGTVTTSSLLVVNEDGAHVCGTSPAG